MGKLLTMLFFTCVNRLFAAIHRKLRAVSRGNQIVVKMQKIGAANRAPICMFQFDKGLFGDANLSKGVSIVKSHFLQAIIPA